METLEGSVPTADVYAVYNIRYHTAIRQYNRRIVQMRVVPCGATNLLLIGIIFGGSVNHKFDLYHGAVRFPLLDEPMMFVEPDVLLFCTSKK